MDSELRLMIPGPTIVSEKVLEKLSLPMMPHYGDEWSAFYFDVVAKAKKVFQTKDDLFILAATSSAAMELAVSHATEPGEKILICNNGFFGDRFAEMAECVGAEVVTTRSEHGQAITEEQVRSALKEHPDIRALAVVHNESSTAVETELSGITAAAQERDVLTIVDCVSSLGAVDIPTDELGIDFCLTGSQKCLAAPAGLALISVSDRAWGRIRSRRQPVPSWYLNLNILAKYRGEWADWHPQGPNSASVPLYLALDQALDEVIEEGLPARFARHTGARDAFRAAMRAMGLELFVEDAVASRTLTAVRLPEGIDGAALRKNMQTKHKILIAGGLGATKNTVIRVGHMAWTASAEHLLPTIEAIEAELRAAGVAIRPGAAAESFRQKFP
ncbi:MAG: alanine--glyoxylate aminotransferase family protein [Planctomycetota bacterium]